MHMCRPAGVSTLLRKNVTIQGAVANGTAITYPTLDWNWVGRVLALAPDVWLTLRGVTIAGFRPVVSSCRRPSHPTAQQFDQSAQIDSLCLAPLTAQQFDQSAQADSQRRTAGSEQSPWSDKLS